VDRSLRSFVVDVNPVAEKLFLCFFALKVYWLNEGDFAMTVG